MEGPVGETQASKSLLQALNQGAKVQEARVKFQSLRLLGQVGTLSGCVHSISQSV